MAQHADRWPPLPVADWQPTQETLHMYSQIVGKVSLMLRPMMNHWWQVGLQLTARGMTTGLIPYGERTFQMDFDLLEDRLLIETSDGEVRVVPLGGAVREVYAAVMESLHELGIEVRIRPRPSEVPDPIRLDEDDRHRTYDGRQARRYWDVLREVDASFTQFRAGFTGKASPVQLYWGSFDLAVSLYSGRPAEPPPGADPITRLSFTAEQSTVGFWPGGPWLTGAWVEDPILFSFTYPEPAGFREQPVGPEPAGYDENLGEFVLHYEDVRRATDPRQVILDFAQSTFEAGARLQDWPLDTLEWRPPPPPSAHQARSAAGG
jgi:hypothetical protein